LLNVGIMTVLCQIKGFPFWGRHLAPIFPFLVVALAIGLDALFQSGKKWSLVVSGLYLAFLLFSCLNLRLNVRNRKDDYRSSAQFAQAALARREIVWWSAAPEGAQYYQLPLHLPGEKTGGALDAMHLKPEGASREEFPNWIITSKPDLYDPFKTTEHIIQAQHYIVARTFPAFVIYRKPQP
jgi:hypothetical protein